MTTSTRTDLPDSRAILESFLIHFDEENLSLRECLLQRIRSPSVPPETLDKLASSLRTLGFDASGYVPEKHCKRCHKTYVVNGSKKCIIKHEWREEPERGGALGYIWECTSCSAESDGYGDGPSGDTNDIRRGGKYCFEGYHTQNPYYADDDDDDEEDDEEDDDEEDDDEEDGEMVE